MPFIVEKYEEWQKRRLDVKPGITGLWQIVGRKNLPLLMECLYSKDMSDRIDFLISQENCKLLQLLECSRVQLVEEEDVNNLTAGLDVFVNLNIKTDLALLNKIFGGITISWRARRL